MARPRLLDEKLIEHAKRLAAQAQSVEDLRCAQAVLLPAMLGATLEQTATALGVGRATVGRCQAKVRKRLTHPAQLDPAWGGRRRAAMSVEEESEFLLPWAESAADGGMLIVAPLRAALAQRLGRAVTHSVVYRLLARHGWRKVAPDTRHPKSDPLTQEQWKKTPRCPGNLPRSRGSPRPTGPPDVPGRGPLRTHGAHSPLLGSKATAAHRVQRVRT